MNITPCSIKILKGLYDISGEEVGQHFYWQIGGFQIHTQVLITSWVYELNQGHASPYTPKSFGGVSLKSMKMFKVLGASSATSTIPHHRTDHPIHQFRIQCCFIPAQWIRACLHYAFLT
jgi:hypothetical protein